MTGLFRAEVLNERQRGALGSVSLNQPVRLWILTAGFTTLCVAIICFALLGEYTRRSRVQGSLVPDAGIPTVLSPVTGVVSSVHAGEGDEVPIGSSLALIDVPRITGLGDDSIQVSRETQVVRANTQDVLDRSQTLQFIARQNAAREQFESQARELVELEREIETRSEQVRLARDTVSKFLAVSERMYVSQVQLNEQKQTMLALVAAKQSLRRDATVLRRNLVQLKLALSELEVQRVEMHANITRGKALMRQESVQLEAGGGLLVRAPVDGLVTSRLVELGQAVQSGQPLFSIQPKGATLHAHLRVPSSAAGFVRPGDRVLLRYKSFPYQKFGSHGGTVLRISRSTIDSLMSHQADDSVYRAVVELDRQSVLAFGSAEPLRAGMELEADILGERRRLYEWMLEPLFSVSGKVRG